MKLLLLLMAVLFLIPACEDKGKCIRWEKRAIYVCRVIGGCYPMKTDKCVEWAPEDAEVKIKGETK